MDTKKKLILIIDDEKSVRQSLSELLDLLNYEVLAACDGKEGVRLALEELPDLIICDITMPKMDGYAVLLTLSKNKATSAIPFIFLTAKSEVSDLRKGMELGADDYLFKPFTMDELIKSIEMRFEKVERIVKLNNETPPSAGTNKENTKKLGKDSHILLFSSNHPESVKLQNILYIEALEHYCNVFTTDAKKLLVRKSMKEWEETLPGDIFIRIHRSTIINLEHVIRFEKGFNNTFTVYLKNVPEAFEISRRASSQIRARVNGR